MRRVNGTNSNSEKQSSNTNKKDSKREAEKSRKTRHDIDSSDEGRTEESLRESGKKAPKINSKQPPKNNDKQVLVAPNSTTYSPTSSTDPRVRPSSKREAYQSKVKRELEIGMQGKHRKREGDLKGNHPELKSLWQAQRQKDWESRPANLDPVNLVKQARSADGHLQAQVKDKKDVDILVKVLTENPSIRSLKLDCDFGGKSGLLWQLMREELHRSVVFEGMPVESLGWPDSAALASILDACKHVEALDLKGCRLTDECWSTLASKLSHTSELRRLEIGGGDHMSALVSSQMTSWIASESTSVRELVIDGLYINKFTLDGIFDSLEKNKNFSLIKLQNISDTAISLYNLNIKSIFNICVSNPNLKVLSMAGTKFSRWSVANDVMYDGCFSVLEVFSADRAFNKHTGLRVLDLRNCGLNRSVMRDVATACDGHASLIEIRIEGNDILDSDLAKIEATTTRNRERLIAQASAAFDLLVSHGAGEIDVWPRELSGVLAQNTPSDILLDIAAVIDPAVAPSTQGRGSAPTATRVPKTSSSSSSSTQSSKKQ
jgi:hypothetical protein